MSLALTFHFVSTLLSSFMHCSLNLPASKQTAPSERVDDIGNHSLGAAILIFRVIAVGDKNANKAFRAKGVATFRRCRVTSVLNSIDGLEKKSTIDFMQCWSQTSVAGCVETYKVKDMRSLAAETLQTTFGGGSRNGTSSSIS